MSLAVIGLDGMTWALIDRWIDDLPTFAKLKEHYGWGTLVCDTIAHSAPSWTTIFTGLQPEQHGIWEYWSLIKGKEHCHPSQQRGRRMTRDDIKAKLLWEELEEQGLKTAALTVYATVPPLNYNCHYTQALPFTLQLTLEEVEEATKRQTMKVLELLQDGVDFLATVFIGPDKAHHVWQSRWQTRQVYQWMDEALAQILPEVDDWLILSDHGYPAHRVRIIYGVSIPTHDPRGIVLSSWMKDVPRRTSEITPVIRAYYESMDEEHVKERLAALGYL